MKWIQITAVFESDNIPMAEELIADMFFNHDIKGVVCNVPLPQPLDGFGSDALPPSEETSISGYLPDTVASRAIVSDMETCMADFGDAVTSFAVRTSLVDQEDWAESWKEFFFVTRITDTVVVKPAWREYDPQPGEHLIELDPGMAFGTGTHPTTSMCVALIEQCMVPGCDFLDVGTGSGILMIAAAKLGAGFMDGIDTDEVAVQVARDNLEKNRIPASNYRLCQSTLDRLDPDVPRQYDLIAANILAEVILAILPDIHRRLKPAGTAVLSGIIREKMDDVKQGAIANGMIVTGVQTQGEWVAMTVTIPQD
ncbi:MAG: 50S ribosomal protein L11 methyltransferase [Pseudomonadota bacterium]